MEDSHNFFMEKIFSQDSRGALQYLSNRGLDTNLIKEHQLGYAPPKWSELYELLNSKGYSDEDLLALGLIKKSEETLNPQQKKFKKKLFNALNELNEAREGKVKLGNLDDLLNEI